MVLTDFSRISQPDNLQCKGAVDINILRNSKVVGIGAGGAYCLYDSLARSGLGKLIVIDFDDVEAVNIVRQGFESNQIGMSKVEALSEHLHKVNEGLNFRGISKNIFDLTQEEKDEIFGDADILLFLTDSFKAQAYGNKLALEYGKPAIWAGFYEKSQCAEIVFTIPGVTPACFRCAVSPRYEAQENSFQEILVSSACNTMMHSQLLDSYIGMILFAILHNDTEGYEFSNWFGSHWDRNLLQIKINPRYESNLFDRSLVSAEGRCPNFTAIWQKVEEEKAPKYTDCPDCEGSGNLKNCKMK
jgi:molybdopterin/thiamine biosynthesis adenylyltransferase